MTSGCHMGVLPSGYTGEPTSQGVCELASAARLNFCNGPGADNREPPHD